MRHSNRWLLHATSLLALASCDPEPAPEAVTFRSSPLDDGAPDTQTWATECEGAVVFETLQDLCALLGMECGAPPPPPGSGPQIATCHDDSRQIFTGVTNPDNSPVPLVGRGRAGHAHADAMLCVMRELSPDLDGPILSEASVDVGIGDVVARQEIGFTSFDRDAHVFEGYRRLEFQLPVLGKVTASAQTIRLAESSVTTTDTSSTTGAVGTITGWGLDVSGTERERIFHFEAPAFDVPTPIGVFEVQPKFEYESHTQVIDAPYDNSVDFDIPNWGLPGITVHFDDLYGVLPGLQYATQDVTMATLSQHQNKGWFSGMALGTRAAMTGVSPWTPPATGPKERPNYDLLQPRSTEEALPTTYVKVEAPLTYPDNPYELLPDWVQAFASDVTTANAYIQLTPSVQAGVGGQLALATHEGATFRRAPDGTLQAFNLGTFSIQAQSRVEASFTLTLTLHLEFVVDFGWPIGEVDLLDVHKDIPILPIDGADESELRTAWGAAFDTSSSLDAIVEFDGTEHIGHDATEAFLEECFAEEIDDQEVPPWEVEPGDPAELFWQNLVPCNICIAVDEKNVGTATHPHWIEGHASTMMPSDDPSSWQCDRESKTGCMDLCWYDAESGELTIAHAPTYLAANAAAAGDYAEAAFYNRCMD